MAQDGAGNSYALLTDFQRELLQRNEWTSSRKQDLRNRLRRGIADFNLLNHYIHDNDLQQVFDARLPRGGQVAQNEYKGDIEPRDGINSFSDIAMSRINATHAIEFFYRGLRLTGNDPYEIIGDVILKGVVKGEARYKEVHQDHVYLDLDHEEDGTLKIDVRVKSDADLSPVEKCRLGDPLTLEEHRELNRRLVDILGEERFMEHIRVGEDTRELVEQHLIDA